MLFFVWICAFFFFFGNVCQAVGRRTMGVGEQKSERKARAEYARVAREMPDSADAKISEAEFIEKFVANDGPRLWVWVLALLGTFIALFLYFVIKTLFGVRF